MDSKLLLFENKNIYDEATIEHGTRVIIRDIVTKEKLFEGHNKVLVAGSAFTMAKHFNMKPQILTPSYNTLLNLENSISKPYDGDGIRKEEVISMFCIGNDGCGQENSQVYNVNYIKPIPEEALVPFRYQLNTNDLGAPLRKKYFGRKVIGDRIAYYFKGFETEPIFKQQFVDGTPIDENIYLSSRTDKVESFVELNLKILKEDARDYYKTTIGIDEARVNCVSLVTSWNMIGDDGFIYHQDIRPMTRINFPNEALIDSTKGIEIIYDIFY